MSGWLLLFVPAALFAAEPFEGTWRIDLQKVELPKKPQTIELANGMYKCSTCVPKISVKADGTDQKVTGDPAYDTLNVKILDAQTVEETYKKGGRTVTIDKVTVSADGSHATTEVASYPEKSAQPVTSKVTLVRVAKGPPGSNAYSGTWRYEKIDAASDNALTITYKNTPDGLAMSDPTGESYVCKFDGKDCAVTGDRASDSVSLKRIDANTFEETFKKDGKVVSMNRLTASADGKSMSVTSESKLQGTTIKLMLAKQ